ncbi:DUF4407 domain-containing protein [Nostoc sp. CHAB 5784]|uniref:DUF4407 domain-containing protein n=1 Tax=Nostoc mirabile TaxID=2907820 RepID=UPI001E285DF9|nr:DUF4407 domain-containing protein [Nostoc mirabile]MCC5668348.1 DUF4407 domain-containing protein [Nostoc mirabile CHAB5784]
MSEIDYSQYSQEILEKLLRETKDKNEAERIADEIKNRGVKDLLDSINSQTPDKKPFDQKFSSSTHFSSANSSFPGINIKNRTNPSPQSSSNLNPKVESELRIPILRRIILFCSGAKLSVLSRKDCEMEHNKYEMIGLTIIFTAIFASLSGAYAFFIVFQDLALSFFLEYYGEQIY